MMLQYYIIKNIKEHLAVFTKLYFNSRNIFIVFQICLIIIIL